MDRKQSRNIISMLGLEQLSPEDRNVVARAWTASSSRHSKPVRRVGFLNFNPVRLRDVIPGGIKAIDVLMPLERGGKAGLFGGKLVSLEDALDGCERILRDEFKDYPESALYMIGATFPCRPRGSR